MPTEWLLLLYRDTEQPKEKRWAACVALGAKEGDVPFRALFEGLSAEGWQMRRFALEGLKQHPRAREAEAAIIEMLFDTNDQVRQTACKVCADLELHGAHDGMLQLLKDGNPNVRDVALNALDPLWQARDFAQLFELYQTDPSRSVRIAAAKTLRAHATESTWRTLYEAWAGDIEVRHRVWACELAGRFGAATDVPAIESLLEDRNRNVRLAAREALDRLQGPARAPERPAEP